MQMYHVSCAAHKTWGLELATNSVEHDKIRPKLEESRAIKEYTCTHNRIQLSSLPACCIFSLHSSYMNVNFVYFLHDWCFLIFRLTKLLASHFAAWLRFRWCYIIHLIQMAYCVFTLKVISLYKYSCHYCTCSRMASARDLYEGHV